MKQKQHLSFWWFLATIFISICSSLLFFSCDAKKLCSSPPSSCGSLNNIRPPFRLKTDPPNCGYRDCELSCEANQPFIYFESVGRYYVESISYENQTIRLIDLVLTNSTCSPFPRKIISRFGLRPFWMGQEQVYFLNCSRSIENRRGFGSIPSCLNSSQFLDYSYFYVGSYMTLQQLSDLGCNIVAEAPISLNGERWDNLWNHASFSAIHSRLRMGFDLSWSEVVERDCGYGHINYNYSTDGFYTVSCISYGSFLRVVAEKLWGYVIRPSLSSIVILLIVRALFGVLFSLHLLAYKLDWRHQSTDTMEGFLENHQSLAATRYSYSEIKIMTDGFREKLGAGGFGSVYKGRLWNGHLVAVKVLSKAKGSGDDFINEVSTIGRIHHVNVVRLLGFCSEGSKRALVYEFMPNGSLEKYIFSKEENDHNLSWEKLFEIALGTARGIDYLHRGCDVRILHFDIKPHNILLDKSFSPKISDFGLAKLCPVDYSIVSMTLTARGTIGYIAPELFSRNFGGVSYKSDVYSFGMLLLEMAGKRKNVNAYADKTSQIYFPSWVYDRLNQGGDLEIDQITGVEEEIVKKMAMVGLWCIQMKPIDRPSMREVLEMLEGSIELLQMPPKPFLTSPRRQSDQGLSSMESEIEVDAGMETDTTVILDVSMSRSQ